VNYSSFTWNPLVENCGSLILPPLDYFLERNLSNAICFCIFYKIFLKCCITMSLNRVTLSVHNCDMGVPLLYKAWGPRDDHVILCSTFEFLFEIQNRIFSRIFLRVSCCSDIRPFEVPESTVLCINIHSLLTNSLLCNCNVKYVLIYVKYLR
jgi:hypothetical protein